MTTPDIDARGLECPKPVLRTKEKLAAADGEFTILVDNEAARDNVSRFAITSGCSVEISNAENGFLLSITPGTTNSGSLLEETEAPVPLERDASDSKEKVIFISSDEVGRGSRELGEALMKSFLYACTENDDLPSKIVLMNAGVKLVTENEDTVEHLQHLENNGIEILVCGTCLDFYGLKKRLQAGRISNMYEIQSSLIGADVLICL
ncbi:MAG: sulfurtransferase-like selenium metabolism protein YedF [Actinobacteria bacterium]|nr:sulfurtransferase-like selenium metabolism protein YedF [Actinomycetota bacterium]